MNTEDIEALLTGAEETDVLEFKGAVPWDRNLFVKDILAMANVIDGGRIVIGVEDGTFLRLGLSAEQVASYRIDEMRDGIAPFADPRAQPTSVARSLRAKHTAGPSDADGLGVPDIIDELTPPITARNFLQYDIL